MSENKIIPSLDVSREEAFHLIKELECVEDKFGGYKVGSLLVMENGINVIKEINDRTELPIIYDGQKLGSDIPSITNKQIELLSNVDVDYAIIYPVGGGDRTLYQFIESCKKFNITPVCVVSMSHEISDRYLSISIEDIVLSTAYSYGIRTYVYPATKPEILQCHNELSNINMNDSVKLSTGFSKDEHYSSMCDLGVSRFIVGRSIYLSSDPVGEVEKIWNLINTGEK